MEEKQRCKTCGTILMKSNELIGLCGYHQRQDVNKKDKKEVNKK